MRILKHFTHDSKNFVWCPSGRATRRFHTSYILLLALYQAKFAAAHGGKVRILCGRSEDSGEDVLDFYNLSKELDSLFHGVDIEVADDVAASQQPLQLQ